MNENASSSTAVTLPPAAPPGEQVGDGWPIAGILFALLAVFILFVRIQSRRYNPPRPPRRTPRVI